MRLGTARRLSTLVKVTRNASTVVASNRISDHWKEVVVPKYAMIILRTVAIATFQLVFAATIFVVVTVAVLSSWMEDVFRFVTFLRGRFERG